MDLESFDQERDTGRSRKCFTCSLTPEILRQIHTGRARRPKPVPFATISKWLQTCHGIVIQHHTLRNHFVSGHHRDVVE